MTVSSYRKLISTQCKFLFFAQNIRANFEAKKSHFAHHARYNVIQGLDLRTGSKAKMPQGAASTLTWTSDPNHLILTSSTKQIFKLFFLLLTIVLGQMPDVMLTPNPL